MSQNLKLRSMKKLVLICFSFFLFGTASAQYNTLKVLAEKEFNDKNYSGAAYYYEQIATGNYKKQEKIPFYSNDHLTKEQVMNERLDICYQLAESYRLYQNFEGAQKWYDTVLVHKNDTDFPLAQLWYGTCLRANLRFDEAIKQLQLFKAGYKGSPEYMKLADREIASCLFANEQYGRSSSVDIKKMGTPWNSDDGNYALSKIGRNYWFTSTRAGNGNTQNGNHIYFSFNSSPPSALNLKDSENIKDMQYSTPSFDAVHKRIYIAGWYKVDGQLISNIFYAQVIDKKPSLLQKLNTYVNAEGSVTMQPFVTPDGKRLFFVSDRAGGQGGFDIWASDLDADGNPVNAVNLGKTINTPEDEEAPFYDAVHKRLVFSSTGFTGLGGFDIFTSDEINGKWTAPVNMGYPINSSKDDLYYFADPDDDHKFYLSSDRESTCCLSLFEGHYKTVVIAGTVMDCDSNKTLSGVKVSLIDSASGKPLKNTATGAGARYTFDNLESGAYKLLFEKNGYFNKAIYFSAEAGKDTLLTRDLCMQAFKVNKPIVIRNILYDFNRADLRPESKKALDGVVSILMDNPTIKIELASHTDSVGSAAYNLKLSQSRAQSCVDYILSKGIDKARIIAVGYGKNRPVAPNSLPNGQDNPDGRQLNRRTEFTVKQ